MAEEKQGGKPSPRDKKSLVDGQLHPDWTDITWETVFYIKNDPAQEEMALVGIAVFPGKKAVKFRLADCYGRKKWFWDNQVTTVQDVAKRLKWREENGGDEDQ